MDKQYELVPVKPVDKPKRIDPVQIGPSELDDYLFTPGIERNTTLPNTFNFSPHAHYLKELYDFSKTDFIYDQETRDKALASAGRVGSNGQLMPSSIQALSDLFSQKAHVESGRTLYLDMDTDKIDATGIDSGKVTEVALPFLELWQQRKVPGLLIHTHPASQMPSAIDYDTLLKDYLENGTRLLRGIMVLCPEVQILALATNKTPLLPTAKVDEMIIANNKLTTDFFEKVTKILTKAMEKGIKRPLDLFTQYMQKTISLLQELSDGRITKDEFDMRSSALEIEHDKSLQILRDEGNPVIGKTAERVKHALNRFGNAALVSFARDANLKLYSSTDMVNFREFSA